MTKKETVSSLKLIKQAVSKLALEYATTEIPMPIPEFTDRLEPFVDIELSILTAIKKLEK